MNVTDIPCPAWLISDTHFGHYGILDLGKRREWMIVDTLTAMHEVMFRHWQMSVAPEQTVLHLGDHITALPQRHAAIAEHLSGRILLVSGNHDHPTPPGIVAAYEAVRFRLPDGRQVLAVHDPEHAESLVHDADALVLHGHLHGDAPRRSLPAPIEARRFDCSMDRLRIPGPVPMATLVRLINERKST